MGQMAKKRGRAAVGAGDGGRLRAEFWRRFPLDELTQAEWEALCDGCAKCCLIKLEDERRARSPTPTSPAGCSTSGPAAAATTRCAGSW